MINVIPQMKRLPYLTILLCVLTLAWSLSIGLLFSGEFFAMVPASKLPNFGGITTEHMANLEVWRLFVAQLIHVKPVHMLYNVFALALVGSILESKIGYKFFGLFWFVSGSIGTLYSSLFAPAPWNAGSGGSQAVLGLCGVIIALYSTRKFSGKELLVIVFFCIVPAFSLDFIFAHYPKPGHVLSMLIGFVLGSVYLQYSIPEEHSN